jgi:hypothetical protein
VQGFRTRRRVRHHHQRDRLDSATHDGQIRGRQFNNSNRDQLIGADVAQTEKGIFASSEVFAVADQGDLLGMIAQVPGITLTSDASSGLPGFSVLGLSSAQNNVTLNGLAFGGGDVPRDIIGAARVSASTYDVSNQIVHATFDAPGLQSTDRIGRQLGQQYTNAVLSGGFSGPNHT